MIREHPYVMKILSEKTTEKQDFTLGIGALEIRGTPANEVKWLPNLMWVAISVGAILAGWFILRALGVF